METTGGFFGCNLLLRSGEQRVERDSGGGRAAAVHPKGRMGGNMGWLLLLAVAIFVVFHVGHALKRPSPKTRRSEPGGKWIERGGKIQKADDVFGARTSGDLPTMLASLEKPTHPVDRHFLLLGIVEATYGQRKDPQMRSTFVRIARQHLEEFSSLKKPLRDEMDGLLPRVPTFQHLATVLTEEGHFEEAVSVCKQALSHGVHDGTKSGFEGRIERIRKKQEQHEKTGA